MKIKCVGLLFLAFTLTRSTFLTANPSPQDMIKAASNGDIEQMKRIIKIDQRYALIKGHHDITPLHYAASNGHDECVEALIAVGANVNGKTSMIGWTPLHFAARDGRFTVVKILIDHGAEVNTPNGYHETPAMLAIKNGHDYIADYLYLLSLSTPPAYREVTVGIGAAVIGVRGLIGNSEAQREVRRIDAQME